MAQSYTLFSTALKLSTKKDEQDAQVAWVKQALCFDPTDCENDADARKKFAEVGFEEVDNNMLEDWPAFSWEIDVENEEIPVWLYSEENCNLDNLAVFVQTFIRKYCPESRFMLEWANMCSKPLIDAFGGGAMIVTAKEVYFHGTGDWIHAKCEAIDKGVPDLVP